MPRLPSGIYFHLLADSAANERHHIPEYSTFAVAQQPSNVQHKHRGRARVVPGLHGSLPQPPQPQLCLPLIGVSIDMQMDCTIAKTKVVQTFTNHGDISIPEAWYSFPLYDGAVVTGFRCEVGDDKVLEGKVKPKDEAKSEFKQAIKRQETAGLGEEMAPDVFQTTVGNVKPKTTVKVEITYVEELLTDLSGEGNVVTIPTSVAPRYGTPPAGYTTNSAVKETGLSLVVHAASPGPRKSIICRSSHEISVEYGNMDHVPEASSFEALAELQNQAGSGLDPDHTTARLSVDQTAMDRDIVLVITSPDDLFLNSRALLAPPNSLGHAAMVVTLRPSELFSDLQESMDEFEGEIMFLADRSGSMAGSKMKELKDALLVFLKSLPAKCRFNLYSFGNEASSLWPLSMPYGDSTIQEALDHVSMFQADFGGTEVLKALKTAVGDRRSINAHSTQIILLTDGEIWESEQTIEFVRMTTSKSNSQVRFFSLGIGNQVSHQLIQGIGFFGGGFGEAVAVDAQGKWLEAVIRMLKGAMMPTSWSYSVAFDSEWEEKRLDVDDFLPQDSKGKASNALKRFSGAVNASFVQAPRIIPWLHHFGQQSVYFLLDTTGDKFPDHVLITASSQYGMAKTVTLAVTKSTSNNNAIQHLAAKAVVRDLENQDRSEAPPPNQIVRNAEQLCQMYSIASKWASFVAVSHLQQSAEYEDIEVSLYKAPVTELDLLTSPCFSQTGANLGTQSSLPISMSMMDHIGEMDVTRARQRNVDILQIFQPEMARSMPSSALKTSDERSWTQKLKNSIRHGKQARASNISSGIRREQSDRNSQIGKDYGSDGIFYHSAPPPPPTTTRYSVLSCSPAAGVPCPAEAVTASGSNMSHGGESLPGTSTVYWEEVIRAQRANGLFHIEKSLGHRIAKHFCHGTRQALGRLLAQHMKEPIADAAGKGGTMELLVDTVMALAYIRSHFFSQRALWDILVKKAERRLASLLTTGESARPDGLAAMADSALAHAHYGRCSQGSDKEPWWESSAGCGRCGVCDSQSEELRSSAKHDDGIEKCQVPGCDLSVGEWDAFWVHAVEQGHLISSCEAARNRYREAAEANEDVHTPQTNNEGQEGQEYQQVEKHQGSEEVQGQLHRLHPEGASGLKSEGQSRGSKSLSPLKFLSSLNPLKRFRGRRDRKGEGGEKGKGTNLS